MDKPCSKSLGFSLRSKMIQVWHVALKYWYIYRYLKLRDGKLFNLAVFKKRIEVTILLFLSEADYSARYWLFVYQSAILDFDIYLCLFMDRFVICACIPTICYMGQYVIYPSIKYSLRIHFAVWRQGINIWLGGGF